MDSYQQECPICCEPLTKDLVETVPCKHHFHRRCLGSWNARSDNCPVCRTHLKIALFKVNVSRFKQNWLVIDESSFSLIEGDSPTNPSKKTRIHFSALKSVQCKNNYSFTISYVSQKGLATKKISGIEAQSGAYFLRRAVRRWINHIQQLNNVYLEEEHGAALV